MEVKGRTKTKLYWVWAAMLQRCENPDNASYHNYGGRGISVCEEWHDPSVFITWSRQHGYKQGLELDRIDNDGNYEPDNCEFVTSKHNLSHTQKTVLLTAFGETKTLSEWSRDARCQCSLSGLRTRLRTHGMDGERAVSTPVGVACIAAWGEKKTVAEWLLDERCTCSESSLRYRLRTGKWSAEEAIATPPQPRVYLAFGERKTIQGWFSDLRCACDSVDLLRQRVSVLGWDMETALVTDNQSNRR